jgi:DNA-binding transcriptional regulator YhcF (GntR family)
VNKREIVNLEGPFEAEALRVLRQIPGLTVIGLEGRADRRIDAVLRFAGNRAPIAVEFKQRANPATAWQLVQFRRTRPDMRLLLVAGETTAEARTILEDHGIAVIDGLGNAHIELPGLLFHLEGRRRPQRPAGAISPTRLKGKAGVVAQALLLHPERAWHVQDLAKAAQVSRALAHRVLARLEREGIVAAEGTGPNRVRRVTNRTAVLDLWAEEYVERPVRTPAHLLAQTPQELINKLGANLSRRGIDYALTGAAAASLVAPFITSLPVVDVWVEAAAAPEVLYDGAQADPVTTGQNVVFLQAKDNTPLAFREEAKGLWLVNRFRLYGDLRTDPRRGREQADHLRREVIGF